MSHGKLKDQQRDTCSNKGRDIGHEKRPAPVVVSHVAETPDIPKANGRPHGSKQKSDLAVPLFSLSHADYSPVTVLFQKPSPSRQAKGASSDMLTENMDHGATSTSSKAKSWQPRDHLRLTTLYCLKAHEKTVFCGLSKIAGNGDKQAGDRTAALPHKDTGGRIDRGTFSAMRSKCLSRCKIFALLSIASRAI